MSYCEGQFVTPSGQNELLTRAGGDPLTGEWHHLNLLVFPPDKTIESLVVGPTGCTAKSPTVPPGLPRQLPCTRRHGSQRR